MSVQVKFRSVDVKWEVDGISMEGTVTIPDVEGEVPGILLIAGSGPTDRDWCSPLLPGTNGSGRLMAARLSTMGYATMRFDKRASGPHAQENAQVLMGRMSMDTHMKEVAGALSAFSLQPGVDRGRLYALTSSEGAIHALNYQLSDNKPKFRGIIMTGVPGRTVGEVAREQIHNSFGNSPDASRLLDHYDKAISDFESGKPYIPDPTVPEELKFILRSITSPANLPFSRELFLLNPLDLMVRVDVPMLILIGKRDIQADWEKDGSRIQERIGGRENVTLSFPEYSNHVLKRQDPPREQIPPAVAAQMYNSESSFLDDEAVDTIARWLESSK